jgi:hypothetical protein
MSLYIREAGVERGDEEIALEVHFDADIDPHDDKVWVDASSIVAYRIDDGNKRLFRLTPSEQQRLSEGLEKVEGGSIYAEFLQDLADHNAETAYYR